MILIYRPLNTAIYMRTLDSYDAAFNNASIEVKDWDYLAYQVKDIIFRDKSGRILVCLDRELHSAIERDIYAWIAEKHKEHLTEKAKYEGTKL